MTWWNKYAPIVLIIMMIYICVFFCCDGWLCHEWLSQNIINALILGIYLCLYNERIQIWTADGYFNKDNKKNFQWMKLYFHLHGEERFITRRSDTFWINDVLRRQKDNLWRKVYPQTLLTVLLSWNSRGNGSICTGFLIWIKGYISYSGCSRWTSYPLLWVPFLKQFLLKH